MASEYIKWQLSQLPEEEEAPRELTPAEKWKNWLYYHKWHIAVAAILVVIAVDLIKSALGIGVIEPDYQVAYVGDKVLPADTATALEQALAAYGEDCNGDGRVTVTLNQYVKSSEASPESASYATASQVKLMADLEECDSYFFLLEDPEKFQADYDILEKAGEEELAFSWEACPVLVSLDLGTYTETLGGNEATGESQEILKGLWFGRRTCTEERTVRYREACDRLWNVLTEGSKG